jgi:[ribosomal protein S5]-alanine N-acetyltransferase
VTDVTRAAIRIDLLTAEDEAELLEFELRNREFFARAVGDRGDEYFAGFGRVHAERVAENEAGTSMLFLVRDPSGRIVGRVNLLDVRDELPELGYRIGADSGGRGYAREAVRLALEAARERGVRRVSARVTADNPASRRVLEVSGFTATGRPTSVGEDSRPAVLYLLEL